MPRAVASARHKGRGRRTRRYWQAAAKSPIPVFQGGDRERALPAVRLGYVLTPGRQCPIRSPLDARVQAMEICLHICRVVLPCHPVYAGGCLPPDGKERIPEQFDVDMVEERCEPFLLPFPCGLTYARQHL